MRTPLVVAIVLTSVAAGCGSSGGSGDSGEKAPASEDQSAAVERVVRHWVDKDDCSLMSDRYAAEGYASASEGQRACENDRSNPGLRAGEYDVASVEVENNRATATLALEPAGKRVYTLVKGGELGWEIDGFSESFRGKPGDTFPYRDNYELNGNPVAPHIEITVLSVKDRARPNADKYTVQAIERSGRRWVRARVRLKSLGDETFDFSTGDFKAVDAAGQRYQPDFQAFEPALGNGAVTLSRDDTVMGFLGFQVPDRVDLSEIRFAVSQRDPLIWKVSE